MPRYPKFKLFERRGTYLINPKWMLSSILILCTILTGCFLPEKAPKFYRYDGSSMEPTISDGNYLTIDPTAYDTDPPERNDIIVFAHPTSEGLYLVKRIIGLPEEKILMQDGELWINDQLMDEPFIYEPARYNKEWLLGVQEYFVLGDNRNNSSDSHSWGALPSENIEGKAVHICLSRAIVSCREIESE